MRLIAVGTMIDCILEHGAQDGLQMKKEHFDLYVDLLHVLQTVYCKAVKVCNSSRQYTNQNVLFS